MPVDTYTTTILQRTYAAHKHYVLAMKDVMRVTGVKFRLPNMPEHISENITKFILRRAGDVACTWDGARGDLVSPVEGRQEVKCFTSDGPPSFTPTSNWDVIYFLDARGWLNDRFILHRVTLQRTSEQWKGIKVSKAQTFDDQCRSGRRPRITWESLHPQIASQTTKVFEGSFDDIFSVMPIAEVPVAEVPIAEAGQVALV